MCKFSQEQFAIASKHSWYVGRTTDSVHARLANGAVQVFSDPLTLLAAQERRVLDTMPRRVCAVS